MTEFNITRALTENFDSLTFTGGLTWVIFKNIKKNIKTNKFLDLFRWVRQMVRPGTSLQAVVTMLRNMKENPGESVVLSPAMAQRQQSLHGI